MQNNYVAFATDLDSTFMHHGMTIAPANKQAARRAVAAGMHFVIASGRQEKAIGQVFKQVGVSGAKVCLNGGFVISEDQRVLVASALAPALCLELFAIAKDVGTNLMCYRRRGVVRYDVTNTRLWRGMFRLHDRRNCFVTNASGLAKRLDAAPVFKAGFNHPDHAVLEQVAKRLAGRNDITAVWASANFLEITNAGVDKLSGLAALAADWRANVSDFVAFGDYQNDLAMIAGVGLGVAMSNAIPEVKSAADQVVENRDYQGVSRVLTTLLGEAHS